MGVKKQLERFKQLDLYHKSIFIFVFVMLVSLVIWVIHQTIRVAAFDQSFFSNSIFGSYDWDYYMDYFNVNSWFYNDGNPYTSAAMSSYPPLALAIAKFFAMFGSYEGGSLAARTVTAAMVSYYVMFIVFTCLSGLALISYGKRHGISVKTTGLMLLAFVFSAPYIYLFGRGNYLVIAITAIAWFFAWYDSDKKWQRELAIVFLAIAAGIKIYPALLAAIFLKKRRFLDFAKAVVYTLALFFLPFLFFNGGFSNISVFLHNLLDFQGKGQVSTHNYSMPTFFYYFAQLGKGFRLGYVPSWVVSVGNAVSYVVLFVGLLFSLFSDKTWKSFALVTLAIILFPAPSYVYSACMLLPVVAMFLLTKEKTKKDFVYLTLFLLMLLPSQFGYFVPNNYVEYSWNIGITVNNFIQHLSMMTMLVMLVYDSSKNGIGIWKKWKQKRTLAKKEAV